MTGVIAVRGVRLWESPTVEILATDDTPPDRLAKIRHLCDEAFGPDFSDDDWQHTLGGFHVTVHDDGLLVAHAAVVARTTTSNDRALKTGYVEGVATVPARQGAGLGSLAMGELATRLTADYEFGALSTGEHHFYERLGWERWSGPTFVRTPRGVVRTQGDDDGIMVLRFGPSSNVDLTSSLTCEERLGDDW